jgi:cupin fold WbuC family metalloprotein
MMIDHVRVSEEVLYAKGPKLVSASDVEELKAIAAQTARRRARICLHPQVESAVHEMIIVLGRETYIPPHRHFDRSESLQVLEGLAQAIFFEQAGAIASVEPIGDYRSGRCFLYRCDTPTFHTLLIETEWLVFVEAAQGPFDPGQTENAPWAPAASDPAAVSSFRSELWHRLGMTEPS